MCEQATQWALWREHHLAQGRALYVGRVGQTVVLCKAIVDEHEVGRDEHSRGEIVANHRRDEGSCFPFHRLHQVVVKPILGIETNVRIITADMPQAQPIIREVVDEPLKSCTGDQAIGFVAKSFRIAQRTGASEFQQCGIGSRIRKEM